LRDTHNLTETTFYREAGSDGKARVKSIRFLDGYMLGIVFNNFSFNFETPEADKFLVSASTSNCSLLRIIHSFDLLLSSSQIPEQIPQECLTAEHSETPFYMSVFGL
jgi:hypothetical protein